MNNIIKEKIDAITNGYKTISKKPIRNLNYEELSKVFVYDSENHKLYRRLKSGRLKEVEFEKANVPQGYCHIQYNDSQVRAHRLIYCLYHQQDVDSELVINHRNEVKTDNNPKNLELVNQRYNTSYSKEGELNIPNVTTTSDVTFQFRFRVGKIRLTYSCTDLQLLAKISEQFQLFLNDEPNNFISLLPNFVIARWSKQLDNELKKLSSKVTSEEDSEVEEKTSSETPVRENNLTKYLHEHSRIPSSCLSYSQDFSMAK